MRPLNDKNLLKLTKGVEIIFTDVTSETGDNDDHMITTHVTVTVGSVT